MENSILSPTVFSPDTKNCLYRTDSHSRTFDGVTANTAYPELISFNATPDKAVMVVFLAFASAVVFGVTLYSDQLVEAGYLYSVYVVVVPLEVSVSLESVTS